MTIRIKNHKRKISVEFPQPVNLEKSYFTKHSLRSEVILKSTWMRNDVTSPECAGKGTANKLSSDWRKIRCTFFPKVFAKRFSLDVRPECIFRSGGVERREILSATPG